MMNAVNNTAQMPTSALVEEALLLIFGIEFVTHNLIHPSHFSHRVIHYCSRKWVLDLRRPVPAFVRRMASTEAKAWFPAENSPDVRESMVCAVMWVAEGSVETRVSHEIDAQTVKYYVIYDSGNFVGVVAFGHGHEHIHGRTNSYPHCSRGGDGADQSALRTQAFVTLWPGRADSGINIWALSGV